MAEKNVITLMLDDLSKQQPIHSALCIGGQHIEPYAAIQWHYFSVTECLSLPFTQRYDFALVCLNRTEMHDVNDAQKTQLLVKLRDLMAKRMLVVSTLQDEKLLRSLGFTQLLDQTTQDFALWQFNILTYKHVPDWFNSKFWANPENWDKYRW